MSAHKLLLFLSVLLCLSIFCSCSGKTENEGTLQIEEKNTEYDIFVQMDGERAICQQSISIDDISRYGTNQVKLHLYPNAFRKDAENKGYQKRLSRYGGIDVTSVFINGLAVEASYEKDSEILAIKLPENVGEGLLIQLSYIVTVPSGKTRLGAEGEIRLCNFYPVLCLYENGVYRDETYSMKGDPLCLDELDFRLTVSCDKAYTIVAPGRTEETITSTQRCLKTEIKNARDVAVLVSRNYQCVEGDYEGTKVRYFYYSDNNHDDRLKTAMSALAVFSVTFGKYPYDTYTLAQAHLDEGGMEYSGMVLLGNLSEDTIVHETAHQWWYGMLGTDSANEAYIDEGLATFCEGYYHLLLGDKAAFERHMQGVKTGIRMFCGSNENINLRLDRPTEHFSVSEYAALCYDRSAQMFYSIYTLTGKECFNNVLRSLLSEPSGRVDSAGLRIAFDTSGAVGPVIDSFIMGKVVIAI